MLSWMLLLVLVLALCTESTLAQKKNRSAPQYRTNPDYKPCSTTEPNPLPGAATDTWVVIVSTSRFWYNYRHNSNTLSIYRSVKRLGVPDSNIILMMAEDFACDPRNQYTGAIYDATEKINLYGEDVEIDYRGAEVTPEGFIRVLTGRHARGVPQSKRLLSSPSSSVLVYMSGHGGEDFLKFQDKMVISSAELGDCFEQMHHQKRYGELLFIIDTCHGASMLSKIKSPGIIGMSSSSRFEDAYSIIRSPNLGVYMTDAFTGRLLEFLEAVSSPSKATVKEMFDYANQPYLIQSHPEMIVSKLTRPLSQIHVIDFFGNQLSIQPDDDSGLLMKGWLQKKVHGIGAAITPLTWYRTDPMRESFGETSKGVHRDKDHMNGLVLFGLLCVTVTTIAYLLK